MKKIIVAIAMLFAVSAYAAPSTHETVIKKFKETFPQAQGVKWYDGDAYSEVSFMDKDVSERVYYDEDGKVFRTIRYYDETKLNPFISQKIKERFRNKMITGITEVQEDADILYQVILQDNKHLYVVNCNGSGEMYLQHKFIRG
ncbi:MAG TPA: hypothetical protein VFT78_06860 [Hanamia sp.]|jgi:hypothetical protein|nr:hypothetical protein [Hanamia sp.]